MYLYLPMLHKYIFPGNNLCINADERSGRKGNVGIHVYGNISANRTECRSCLRPCGNLARRVLAKANHARLDPARLALRAQPSREQRSPLQKGIDSQYVKVLENNDR